MIAFREGAGVWGSNVRSRAVSRHTTSEWATITEYETISARQNTNLDMKLSQPCNGDIPGDNKKMKTKNCSLSIVLTSTDQKPQTSLKRWYYPPSHRLNVNVMLSNILFNDFCVFWSVAVNTVDKLQFLVLIFAVLLSKLCNALLWNNEIYLSIFSILKIAALRHIKLSKIKKLNFTSGSGDQCASLCQTSSKSIKRLQRYGELTVLNW